MQRVQKKSSMFLPMVLLAIFCAYLNPNSVAQDIIKKWQAASNTASLQNPVNSNRRSVNRGERLFSQRCAVCHGEEGAGDGPGGRALAPKPADLTTEFTQQQTDGSLFWKIAEGRGAMPAWKTILDDAERWNLVNYIRSLPGH